MSRGVCSRLARASGALWGRTPQRQAQLLAATTPTSCSSTACRVVLGDPYYATGPAARLEPRAIAPRRSILLLSLWLRNLPFCFSCSHILFLFFFQKMLHDSVCPCSLLEFRSAFTFMILFINFILCSVQDIGDIQLVSDLLTPQASGQRLACRSIYDHAFYGRSW